MNIYLLGKDSAMLFFEKEDLEAYPDDDLYALAASVLPGEFSEEETELVSFSINGGLVLHVNRRKKADLVLRFVRPGQIYDRLMEHRSLFEGQYVEVYRVNGAYYAVLEDCRLARLLRDGLDGLPVSLAFVLEHGVRVSSFVLKRETVGQGSHHCLKGVDRH
jgi:hypothetical protein